MKIALCGPADLHALAREQAVDCAIVPEGIGPTPLAPLISELLARGHEVTLYTLSHDIQEEKYFKWGALRVFVGPSATFGAVRSLYAREREFLRRVISADRPAFVHSHWTYGFTLGALEAGVPVLVTIHDLPWNVFRYFLDRCRAVHLMLAYVVAFRANWFTAVSEDAARHFKRYIRPGAKVSIIPNFIPKIVLEKTKGPRTHPGRPLVFATVLQGWTRRKNPKTAMRAFAKFGGTHPGSQFKMIGTDYQKGGPAEIWARQNNMAEGLEFLGRIEYSKMLEYIQTNVDVLIIPSLDESFSMVALEGMTLGKPVIAGRQTPGVRDVLDRGAAGMLVDVKNARAIAAAMVQIETDFGLYEVLSKAGYLRAISKYHSDTVIAAYESLYLQIVPIRTSTIR